MPDSDLAPPIFLFNFLCCILYQHQPSSSSSHPSSHPSSLTWSAPSYLSLIASNLLPASIHGLFSALTIIPHQAFIILKLLPVMYFFFSFFFKPGFNTTLNYSL
uniref:Uncharacterized protein n=1 Tax=Opuntia streptacantha TaxID=393608 RepID=A0A7C8YMA3_OPUST